MKKIKDMINKKIFKKHPDYLVEQYKLYVETADNVSERRTTSNNFYLTLNSILLPLLGYMSFLKQDTLLLSLLSLVGILISFYWLSTIRSYKNLNTGKFAVIHELEKNMPAEIFRYEWDYLDKGNTSKYNPLTHVEMNIPKIFIFLYFVIIIITNLG